MTQILDIHPLDPQARLIRRAADALRAGELLVYPTDSCYALGCALGEKNAMERIHRLRDADKDHNYTLVCADLSQIAVYARVEDWQYRLLKRLTPGPYTFILPATKQLPRRLWNPRRRTIGIRVPDHPVPHALLEAIGEPIMSSTLQLPGDPWALNEPEEIRERLLGRVDMIIDSGPCGVDPTTVLDLSGGAVRVLRQGLGPLEGLGLD